MRVVLGVVTGLCFLGLSSFSQASEVVARYGLSLSKYEKELTRWSERGFLPSMVDVYRVNGKLYFATIWQRAGGKKWFARHDMSAEEYQSANRRMIKQGYRLKHVSGYGEQKQAKYIAVWLKEKGPDVKAHLDLTSETFEKEQKNWCRKGYRLVHIKGYAAEKTSRHIAIWIKHKAAGDIIARIALAPEAYQKEHKALAAKGYHLAQLNGYSLGGKARYDAIWEKGKSGKQLIRRDLSSTNYQSELDNQLYSGYTLKKVSGYAIGKRAYYSATWEGGALKTADAGHLDGAVDAFMKKYSIPGLSLAIARKGKLVFARGYGLSRVKPAWTTSPLHKFRIGQVSRSITSLAVMKLAEQSVLKLDDKVFGAGSILGRAFGKQSYSKAVRGITVGQLVRGNGDVSLEGNKAGGDVKSDEVIIQALKQLAKKSSIRPEDMSSRFRFEVLGKIIEAKSGVSYEKYIRKHVLAPAGIRRMSLARNARNRRRKNEVVYYGREGVNAYSQAVSQEKAGLGWLASPVDLVRLMVHADGFSSRKDIVNAASLKTLTTSSLPRSKGVSNWFGSKKEDWSYTGSLVGSKVVLVRTSSEFCWAIMTNTNGGKKSFDHALEKLGHDIVSNVKSWPEHDLFSVRR